MKKTERLSTMLLILAMPFFSGEARAQSEDAPKLEIGAQFSSLSLNAPDSFQTETQPGFGARVIYNFTDFFAVEAEGNFHPRRGGQTLTTGGHVTQGQFGVKAGKRFEKFGVFGKARPGFVSFSGVFTFAGALTQNFPGGSAIIPFFEPRAKTHFSTDVGGVVEFYPSRRVVTRFDFGDTIIRYDRYQVPVHFFPTPLTQSFMLIERPGQTKHNFQFTAGVGWRF